MKSRLLPFAVALVLGACQGSDASPRYPSTAYEGRVDVVIDPPGGRAHDERGRGTARFTPASGGAMKLSVIGAISNPDGDAGLLLDGRMTRDGGWSGRMGDVRVDIDGQGRVSGGGVVHPQAYTVTGQVSPASFDMVVVVELLEPNAGGLPRGTKLRFTYDLEQPGQAPSTARRRGRRADMENCRNVAYEVRPVPDPAGGTLVMRRMPVCRD
ncbi:hypothetical protein [Luteimonas padinae]|uniref:Lipoprotein n=1 Tax=Luteimonas padinae TaxID=1714359 RepID=A0ABV6SVA4_9GAMM|nr:hypothetical protein [Luteimonas padinae]